jgi:two-component system, NarL family, nitrate/nitrite response regulator NarL
VVNVKLTQREQDIVREVARGLTNRQVASKLRLSEQTVKNQVSVLLEKLQVSNRVQLVLLVRERWPELLE